MIRVGGRHVLYSWVHTLYVLIKYFVLPVFSKSFRFLLLFFSLYFFNFVVLFPLLCWQARQVVVWSRKTFAVFLLYTVAFCGGKRREKKIFKIFFLLLILLLFLLLFKLICAREACWIFLIILFATVFKNFA